MMAGTGVSGVGGGVGMLRTRRRDVSVKPNRKLDRKSSRGMIYENEELRLRTIHINAEVEQGQNDIKKLRRENEQLRREIWSLRDEYDKLEEILKRQKSRGESEEYEDRSEENDGLHSDYSYEEDQEIEEEENDDEKTAEELNQEEQLENAENQKISSEKMSSSSLHRLHVDFDDLSVVDEEEELKKEKERKEPPAKDTHQQQQGRELEQENPFPILGPRQLHENIPFYPASYEPTFTGTSFYSECPFEFPSVATNSIIPADTSALLASSCPGSFTDPLIPLASLDSLDLDRIPDESLSRIHAPPMDWQNAIMLAQNQPSSYPVPKITETLTQNPQLDSRMEYKTFSSNVPSLSQRRNILRQAKFAGNPFEDIGTQILGSGDTTVRNGWTLGGICAEESGSGNDQRKEDTSKKVDDKTVETPGVSSSDRPKHFFAPLPSKVRRQTEEESPTASASYFGTGNSSSSGKTGSTVISRNNQFGGQKGSADICVNGAVPCEDVRGRDDQRTFLSTDNLLIEETRSSANQLVKSMSCQDLTSESQNMTISEQLKMNVGKDRPQTLTKSDNTLDSISSTTSAKPYKSHLNVTLKMPRMPGTPSPETPEIPKLPSVDYRIFRNPFLRNLDQTCANYPSQTSPVTKPLTVQVSDNAGYQFSSPPPAMPSFSRGNRPNERYQRTLPTDKSRLLIPSDQLVGSKILSPRNKEDIQITSFEKPSPHTLIPPAAPYDFTTLRRIAANRYLQSQNLYQNVPFLPRGPIIQPTHVCPQRGHLGLCCGNATIKVPAQTQTSIDGDSHQEDNHRPLEEESISTPSSPSDQRRKKTVRKGSTITKDQKPLSPAAQRRLRKQSSVTSTETPDSPGKFARKRPRRLSVTTTTTSETHEDKNESRSSSSGQDSPRKDQTRRVSIYFNAKKRPSVTSVKTTRSGSLDTAKDKYLDGVANSERERTNSVSSREASNIKRKTSTSSGSVPWCACWGNGCI